MGFKVQQFFWGLVLISVSLCAQHQSDEPIVPLYCERADAQRVQEYMVTYEKEKRQEKVRRIVKVIGATVAGVAAAGLGTWGALKTYDAYHRKHPASTTLATSPDETTMDKVSGTFWSALKFSFAASIINGIWFVLFNQVFPAIKKGLFGPEHASTFIVMGQAQQFENSVQHLGSAFDFVQEHEDDVVIRVQAVKELESAYRLFVYSAERFFAVFLAELKANKEIDQAIIQHWLQVGDTLFIQINACAQKIEADINNDSGELSDTCVGMVETMQNYVTAFLRNALFLYLPGSAHAQHA